MMIDPRTEVELGRAAEAKMLLEHPLIAGALAEMRSTILNRFKSTPLKDSESREHFHKFLILGDTFEGILRTYVDTGTLAAQNLEAEREIEEHKQSLSDKLKEFWKF